MIQPFSERSKAFLELGYMASRAVAPGHFRELVKRIEYLLPVDGMAIGLGVLKKEESRKNTGNSPPLGVDIWHLETFAQWPDSFMKEYLLKDYLQRDGQFFDSIRQRKPVLWLDHYRRYGRNFNPGRMAGIDPGFAELAQDFRLTLTMRQAYLDANGVITNLSFNFLKEKDAWNYRGVMEFISPFMHETQLRIFGPDRSGAWIVNPSKKTRISPRENEVLSWVVEGKSNWEIGIIMGIAERTVNFHLFNLKRKFHALNRFHLVAKAMEWRSMNKDSLDT